MLNAKKEARAGYRRGPLVFLSKSVRTSNAFLTELHFRQSASLFQGTLDTIFQAIILDALSAENTPLRSVKSQKTDKITAKFIVSGSII